MSLPSAPCGALPCAPVPVPLSALVPLPARLLWLALGALLGMLAVVPSWAAAPSNPQWDFLLRRVMQHHGTSRAAVINLAVNQFEYLAAPAGSGRWQTPKELVARGAGSCQDFALAKFWLLRRSGVHPEQVRLAMSQVEIGGQTLLHLVVLLWTDRGEPWVLDNLVPGMHRLAARPELQIDYTFDERQFYGRDGRSRIAEQPLRGWRGTWDRISGPATL